MSPAGVFGEKNFSVGYPITSYSLHMTNSQDCWISIYTNKIVKANKSVIMVSKLIGLVVSPAGWHIVLHGTVNGSNRDD